MIAQPTSFGLLGRLCLSLQQQQQQKQ